LSRESCGKLMLPFKRVQKMNTVGNLWLYILSLLAKRSVYGYELQKVISKKFDFKLGKITSYRVLYRLQEEGFVKSKIKERKRIYEITEKGKREFKKAKEFYKNLVKTLCT